MTKVSPKTGAAESLVTITDKDFNGATSVLFDGLSATFAVDPGAPYEPYGTRITATVPTGEVGRSTSR